MQAQPDNAGRARAVVPTRLMAAQPDALLARLAARGNVAAFSALYERHRLALVAFVYHLLGRGGSAEDAEDIAQEAFARAFSALSRRRPDGSFKAWLYTIARNRTFDHVRARRETTLPLEDAPAQASAAAAADQPEQRAEQRDELAWLLAAVATMPERQREALLLKEMAGLSHESIANELDTTVSATKKLIGRARDNLDAAAAASGHRRSRRLGSDLALAAPILPISVSLAALGVGGASGAAGAAAGVGAAGKLAATFLAVAAIGGGTLAVEHERGAPVEAVDAAEGRQTSSRTPATNVLLDSSGVRAAADRQRRGDDDDDDDADERREDARERREDAREDRREAREERREARQEAREEAREARKERREARREAAEDAEEEAAERKQATGHDDRDERDSEASDDDD